MKGLRTFQCADCGFTGPTDKPVKDSRGVVLTYRRPKCGGAAKVQ